MCGAEKRSLHRQSNKYGLELTAILQFENHLFICQVFDFNALGVQLKMSSIEQIEALEQIEKMEIKYGEELICSIENPQILRKNRNSLSTVVSLQSYAGPEKIDRSNRIQFNEFFQGMLWGVDPLSVDHKLYFRVSDLSASGFRITCSKTNGHITPGMTFHNFDLQIPGQKQLNVSFQIKNVRKHENNLSFGCKFTEVSKEYDLIFRKLKIVHSNPNETDSEPLDHSEIKSVKRFVGDIRVNRVRSKDEFNDVLKVRYKAYKAANKVTDNQTEADMEDPYDQHSIVLSAAIGRRIVGTIRIVMREPQHPLPCEKSFELEKIKNILPGKSAEVSRFAIDPAFQGTDLFISIARKLVVELGAKKIDYPLCMATKKLAPTYLALGAVQVGPPIPHPTIPEETLTLYLLDIPKVLKAQVSSISWVFVHGPTLTFLRRLGIIGNFSKGFHHYLLLPFELIKMKFFSKKKRKKKSPRA